MLGSSARADVARFARTGCEAIAHADAAECAAILARGSKSFAAAAKILPARVRTAASIVYAFCRVADDAVDESGGDERAIAELHARLDAIEAGEPFDHAIDRALAIVVRDRELPMPAFRAMIEGFEWDVQRRRYESLPELRAYCVRVAGTVGLLMSALMGERRKHVLARACDLGVAMQLTNIARDVGEDARNGRIYAPLSWLREASVEPDALLLDPRFSPEIGFVVRRLLTEAEPLYRRADLGIPYLPADCRLAIASARHIYADIGEQIALAGYDSVTSRAHTSSARKIALIGRAASRAWISFGPPTREPALPEADSLIAACCCKEPTWS